MLTVIAMSISSLLINHIAARNGIEIEGIHYSYYIHAIFYTLNEEIVLGAILLFLCLKMIKAHPLVISSIIAACFALFHFVFYKWVFTDSGIIHPITLFSLFLVGIIRNNLIIIFRHVGFSWALHFSWIVVVLGSQHYDVATGAELGEPDRFNVYLGSLEMNIIGAILVMLTILLYFKKQDAKAVVNF